MRITKKIDKRWKFFNGDPGLGGPGIELPWSSQCKDDDWPTVDLPHDWRLDFDPDENCNYPFTTVAGHLELRDDSFLPTGTGWYRKSLEIDDSLKDQRIYIEFEGVFSHSSVWINGHKLGTHLSGYTGFLYDITDFVKFGDEENMLVVFVDPRTPEGWWYEGGGIYRHVWLITTAQTHIENWGVFVTTPEVSHESALVNISTEIKHHSDNCAKAVLVSEILDSDLNVVASVSSNLSLTAEDSLNIAQECVVENPSLWSPDAPSLYSLSSKLYLDDKLVDTLDTEFGIRWFEFTSDKGFFLNGEHLKVKGGCIHHDFGGLGVALQDRANYKTVEVLKEMGSNSLRAAHNAMAPSMMDACDRLGLLFFGETRYLPLAPPEETIPHLKQLIHRDRNHPSIISWCLGNTSGHPDGSLTKWLKELNDVSHEEDPTRPTMVAFEFNAQPNDSGFSMVTDIVGYNGSGMGRDDPDHETYPDRKMLVSEYAACPGARGIYEDTPTPEALANQKDDEPVSRQGIYVSCLRQCEVHEQTWTHIAERPWLAGGLIWSGIDYRGEGTGWPTIRSQYGVLDICRFPKEAYYYYKQEWCDEPMVHIARHWNWSGKEGSVIDLWCYSNCEEVELFQDGCSLGTKKTVKHGHISWDVTYKPGKLVAKGINSGEVICESVVQTAGDAAALAVEADRSEVIADSEDLLFLRISVLDKDGVFCPESNSRVTVSVEGTGSLVGLSNGDARSHESCRRTSMQVYKGLMLAVVQSTGEAGEIKVTVSSNGLNSATAGCISQN